MRRTLVLWTVVVGTVISVWLLQRRPAENPSRVAGTIMRLESGVLTLVPAHRPGRALPTQSYAIEPHTKLLRDDLGIGGIKPVPAAMSELKPGLRVLVLARGQAALAVRVLAPPPVVATLVAADGNSIVVKRSFSPSTRPAADEVFQVDPGRTRVSIVRVQYGPARQVDVASLRAGQQIIVRAKQHFAYLVSIQPIPPVLGQVGEVDEGHIVIVAATRPSASVAVKQSFAVDRDRTELYHTYVGELASPALWEEFQVGSAVAVTIEDGLATAISLVHPAIRGKLAEIGAEWVSVIPTGSAHGMPKRFKLDEHSRIELGKELGSTKLKDGHTRRFWKYVPGGRLVDLWPGELVSVTARGDLVLSMRVTPVGTRAGTVQ